MSNNDLSFCLKRIDSMKDRKVFTGSVYTVSSSGTQWLHKIVHKSGRIYSKLLDSTVSQLELTENTTTAKRFRKFFKTGYTHWSQVPGAKECATEARKNTLETLYGVSAPLSVPGAVEKYRNTNTQRYGGHYNHPDSRDGKRRITEKNERMFIDQFGVTKEKFENSILSLVNEGKNAFEIAKLINCGVNIVYVTSRKHNVPFKGNSSNIENKFVRLVETRNNVKFEKNVRNIVRNPETNHFLEIDAVDRINKLSIEFNGVYWHRGKNDRDVFKAKEMRRKGYRHISVDEHDNFDILADILNPNKHKRYARKCKLIELSSKAYTEFVNANHLKGAIPAKYKYGLIHEDELIQVISFSKPRYDKTADFEIIRLCTLRNHAVVGGFAKLLKHFIKTHDPNVIVSYCDLRYFDGSSYISNGFDVESETLKSYTWGHKNGGIRYSRYQVMKHLLPALMGDKFNNEETAEENLLRNGYIQTYDFGQLKLKWRKK